MILKVEQKVPHINTVHPPHGQENKEGKYVIYSVLFVSKFYFITMFIDQLMSSKSIVDS